MPSPYRGNNVTRMLTDRVARPVSGNDKGSRNYTRALVLTPPDPTDAEGFTTWKASSFEVAVLKWATQGSNL